MRVPCSSVALLGSANAGWLLLLLIYFVVFVVLMLRMEANDFNIAGISKPKLNHAIEGAKVSRSG